MPSPLVHDLGVTNITSARPGSYVASGRLGSFVASNGSWYSVYFLRDGGTLHPQIEIYKSTDHGTTYSTLVATGAIFILYVSVFRCPGTDLIYIAYEHNDGSIGDKILTDVFDMSTETFRGVNDPGVTLTSNDLPDQAFNITANAAGKIILAWTLQPSGDETNGECYYRYFDGVSWSSDVHINASTPRGVAENILLVGSNFYILWSNWIANGAVGSSFGVRVSLFVSIVAAGSITSTVTALLDASKVNNTTLSWPVLYPGTFDSGSDSVAFPIMSESNPHTPASDVCTMSVLVGTPSSAPVFSKVDIFTTSIFDIVSSPRLDGPMGQPFSVLYAGFPLSEGRFAGVLAPTAGIFCLLWSLDNGGSTITYQNAVSNALASGWSAPGQFLDTGVSTSDTDPEYFFWIHSDSPAPPPPGNPTLTLTKTVVGGNANANQFFLEGVGNNNTVSGFGNATGNVQSGLFQLSESGPVGVTWDNIGKTWANANTTWFGGYVGVWDCGGAFMPTNNSVFVPASGNNNVTRPIQVPSDPNYRQMLSGKPFSEEIGSNLYEVLWSPVTSKIGVFKRATSSVGGAWAEQDAAHSPDQGSQSGYGKALVNSTTITVAYLKSGQRNMVLCSFNTSTNLWGTPTAPMTVESALATFAFGQQAGGTFVILAGGVNHFYYALNSGGVWTGPTNLELNRTNVLDGFMDSVDAMHILINQISAGVGYKRIPSDFSVTAPPTGVANAITFAPSNYPVIIPWGASSIAISVIDNGGGNALKAQVWIGTPLAAASFTDYVVYGPSAGETLSYLFPVQARDASLSLFFGATNLATPQIDIKQSNFSGSSWSAPTVFYDAVANPPSSHSNTSDQVIQTIRPTDLAAGWAVGGSLNTLQPGLTATGQFIESIGSNASVTCVITNRQPSPPPPPPVTGTCRTILHLWQLAASPQVEITTDRFSDWNNGGHEGNKFYQGLKLDADTFGAPKTLMIRDADTNTLHVLQPGVVNHAGRQVIPYSFQQPFSAHMVRDEPQDLVPWRKFGVTYVYELTPESVQTWITQFTAHGLKGYQHIARIEAAYASTAPVTLTITSFDGTSPAPVTLPPTGGAYQKLLVTLTLNKGQLYRYAAQSSAPFQLYLDDWIVWVGMWGRQDAYLPYRNLGGNFGDKATI